MISILKSINRKGLYIGSLILIGLISLGFTYLSGQRHSMSTRTSADLNPEQHYVLDGNGRWQKYVIDTETSFPGAKLALKKKVADGHAWLVLRGVEQQVWWQKDTDQSPKLVGKFDLSAEVWKNDDWVKSDFNFAQSGVTDNGDGTYTVTDNNKITNFDALRKLTVVWNSDKTKFDFFTDVPGEKVRTTWTIKYRTDSLRQEVGGVLDVSGLEWSVEDYSGNIEVISETTVDEDWKQRGWIFEPDGYNCPDDEDVETGLVIDPNLYITEPTNYIHVYNGDGYHLKFATGTDVMIDSFRIQEDSGSTIMAQMFTFINSASVIYYTGYDDARSVEIIENTANRVTIRERGNFEDSNDNALANYDFENYYYIYGDRIIVEYNLIVGAGAANSAYTLITHQTGTTNITNETVYHEASGAEVESTVSENKNTAKYLAVTSTEYNCMITPLSKSSIDAITMTLQAQGVNDDITFKYSNITSPAAGTYTDVFSIIFDGADRSGGKKYGSETRLQIGDELTDTTAANPNTGTWITDAIYPLNIGADGFCEDGVWYTDHSSDEVDITLDLKRQHYCVGVRDLDMYTGPTATKAGSLLAHYKLDDNTTNTTLVDVGGSYNDAISGDNSDQLSTTTSIRNRGLQLDGSDDFLDFSNGIGAVSDDDIFSVSFWFRPTEAHNANTWQPVVYLGSSTTDRLLVMWDAANGQLEFWNDIANAGNTDQTTIQVTASNNYWQQWHHMLISVDLTNDLVVVTYDGTSYAFTVTEQWAATVDEFELGVSNDANFYFPEHIFDEVKIYDAFVLPYGAYFMGNGQGLIADVSLPHPDVTVFWDAQGTTVWTPAGNTTGTLGSGNDDDANTFPTSGGIVGGYFDNESASTDYYFDISSPTGINDGGSFVLWFSANDWTTGLQFLTEIYTDTNNRISLYNTAGGFIRLQVRLDSTTASTIDTAAITNGMINCVKVTWEDLSVATSLIKIYLNGMYVDAVTVPATITSDLSTIRIGARTDNDKSSDIYVYRAYLTNDPNTPEIWTADRVPVHIPEVIINE